MPTAVYHVTLGRSIAAQRTSSRSAAYPSTVSQVRADTTSQLSAGTTHERCVLWSRSCSTSPRKKAPLSGVGTPGGHTHTTRAMLHVQQNVPKQGRRYALVPLLQTPATGYRSEADSSCCTSCAVDSKQRPCWAVHLGRSARHVQESHRPGYAVLKQLTDRMCVCVCV